MVTIWTLIGGLALIIISALTTWWLLPAVCAICLIAGAVCTYRQEVRWERDRWTQQQQERN